ncbi:hypothetical protein [Pelagicoccus sp. SDUM812003]|uniref:hypothetical protein n=1 Tax=Pelagicoccus sp. SDUM812003 TaxID=3041267 RepID=UPI00280F6120|nr:hypothetical protein [Pelagicoccus sp. SDUM812003]MDQ8204719.1 hypothetical protein [Pelagicoccus sp. SDUM812003]
MLTDTKTLSPKPIQSSQGKMGRVADFYVDDRIWRIPYLVMETDSWLRGRLALLAPVAFDPNAFASLDAFRVNLSKDQAENCPPFDSFPAVPRSYLQRVQQHYQWEDCSSDVDKGNTSIGGMDAPVQPSQLSGDESHVRTLKSFSGLRLHASDGPIGRLVSMTMDTRTWEIAELVIEIGHWLSVKRIPILPDSVNRIDYDDATIHVTLTKDEIRETRDTDVAQHAVVF